FFFFGWRFFGRFFFWRRFFGRFFRRRLFFGPRFFERGVLDRHAVGPDAFAVGGFDLVDHGLARESRRRQGARVDGRAEAVCGRPPHTAQDPVDMAFSHRRPFERMQADAQHRRRRGGL